MEQKKPLPQINADNRAFWEGCRDHKLKIQKCLKCGKFRWPPAFTCPDCLSEESEWVETSGRADVYTYAVYHQAFQPGFEGDVPYVVAIIELEEGPRMMTNITGCSPENVFCGMKVEVSWDDIDENFSIPRFVPAD